MCDRRRSAPDTQCGNQHRFAPTAHRYWRRELPVTMRSKLHQHGILAQISQ
jgi:hypothetical protein